MAGAAAGPHTDGQPAPSVAKRGRRTRRAKARAHASRAWVLEARPGRSVCPANGAKLRGLGFGFVGWVKISHRPRRRAALRRARGAVGAAFVERAPPRRRRGRRLREPVRRGAAEGIVEARQQVATHATDEIHRGPEQRRVARRRAASGSRSGGCACRASRRADRWGGIAASAAGRAAGAAGGGCGIGGGSAATREGADG